MGISQNFGLIKWLVDQDIIGNFELCKLKNQYSICKDTNQA